MKLTAGILLLLMCFLQEALSQCANSLVFDGQNTGVSLPATNRYYTDDSGGYTWECWFKLNAAPSGTQVRPLISAMDGVVYEDQWLGFGWNGGVFNEPVTRLVFKVDGPNSMVPSSPACSYEPAGGFQPYTWYHVAAVMDYVLHQASLYVNGQLVAVKQINTAPITRLLPASLSYPVSTNPQLSLYGNMDEVRIWDQPRTAAQVNASYQSCLSGTEDGLLLYYHCNEGVGSVIDDVTGHQRDGEFMNVQGWSEESAPLADMSCLINCACPPVDAGSDVIVCAGTSAQLSASPGFAEYRWEPSAGLSNPLISNPMVSTSVTTTYTVTATIPGPNILINGDFSQGNTGFTSGLFYSTTYQPCNYFVAPAFFLDPSFGAIDHSPTNDNMFMSADGCYADSLLWQQQSIVVEPNTNYRFKFWATRAGVAQPIFKVVFTGNDTGIQTFAPQAGVAPSNNDWVWDGYGVVLWNSGSNVALTIQLYNLQFDGLGNDFGLDDFVLQKLGCMQTDEITVKVSDENMLDLGPDIGGCAPFVHVLDPGTAFTVYNWSNGSTAQTLTVTNPGTYWVTVTNPCTGISETDSITIFTLPPPSLDLGSDMIICAGETAHLTSGQDQYDGYQWSGTGLSCYTCPDPQVTPLVSGIYQLEVVDSQGCKAKDDIQVIIDLPFIDLGNDLTICKGDVTHFKQTYQGVFNVYQWSTSAGLSCSDCANPEVSPSDTTLYSLVSTTIHGCIATDSIHVFVKDDAPEVFTTTQDATCEQGGNVIVEAIGNGTGDLQFNFDYRGFSTDPLYKGVPAGNYLLLVRNGDDGCISRNVVLVEGEYNVVFIPNAFTPDGNELNNVWRMEGTCVSEINCIIYNRWGEEIMVITDMSQAWDGTFLGQLAPDGIYSYRMKVTYGSHYGEIITGFIALIR